MATTHLAADRIRIVLVETTHPGNIGATARAMKNMGLSRLYLVAPRHFPHPDAEARAANAVDILRTAVVLPRLIDAVGDCGWLLGTSARQRSIPWPTAAPREAAQMALKQAADTEVGILFGREDRGLRNEELQLCHQHLQIPTAAEYPALNLAMAVQIISYELCLQASAAPLQIAGPKGENWDEPAATVADIRHLLNHIEQLLQQLDFLNPAAPRRLRERLNRLLLRGGLDRMEVSMLRGMLRAVQKWLPGD